LDSDGCGMIRLVDAIRLVGEPADRLAGQSVVTDIPAVSDNQLLYTVRSTDLVALGQHFQHMQSTGWLCTRFRPADQWHYLEPGTYVFSASKARDRVSKEEQRELVEWDQRYQARTAAEGGDHDEDCLDVLVREALK